MCARLAWALASVGAAGARRAGAEELATWQQLWLGEDVQELLAAEPVEAGQGPYIAPAFSADITVLNMGKGAPPSGKYWRDVEKQRWRLRQCMHEDLFHTGQMLCFDQLGANVSAEYNMNYTIGTGDDRACKVTPSPFLDTFLPFALHGKFAGNSSVAGEPCAVWTAFMQTIQRKMNLSTCLRADGAPLLLNQTSDTAFSFFAQRNMAFSNITLGVPPEDTFRPSEACTHHWPPPPCPNSAPAELTLYRSRGAAEPETLDNRNVGDALGDMAFFCDMDSGGAAELVTSWRVRANSSWAEYSYCFFMEGRNACVLAPGAEPKAVGRESAMGLGVGARQGQCSENQDVGSWFSFPAAGRCLPGAALGDGGCTWTARPMRTVSARCILEERGLREVCKEERGHAPLLRSTAIFEAALASSDPAKGGCPDAEVFSAQTTIVV